MILSHRVNETDVIWVDGIIPSKNTLQSILSPSGLLELGLKNYSHILLNKRNKMRTKFGRDDSFRTLLACDLKMQHDCEEMVGDVGQIFYLVPPCRKLKYAAIRQSLRDGTYSPRHLSLIQYGPEKVLHVRRDYRYRQIVVLNSSANKLLSPNHFLQSLHNIDFRVLNSYYDRRSWGCSLFNEEVRYLLEHLVSASREGRLHEFIPQIEERHGFEIYRIQSPEADSHTFSY